MSDTHYPDPIHGAQTPSRADTADELDREAFFTTPDGLPTVVTGGDLPLSIPDEDRGNIEELARYWAVYPYSYVSICRSRENGEIQYYVVEPFLSEPERDLIQFLFEKVDQSLRRDTGEVTTADGRVQRADLRRRVFQIIEQYDLFDPDPLRAAHRESESELLEPSEESGSKIQEIISGLIGSEESEIPTVPDYEYDGPDAMKYGATGTRDYLPVVDTVGGHPAFRSEAPAGRSDEPTDAGEGAVEQTVETDGGAAIEDGSAAESDTVSVDDTAAGEAGLTSMGGESALTAEGVRATALGDSEEATLTEYHLYKILYYVEREIIGYGQIDAIKNDQSVEDITCNGYNEPVFVYHTQHQQIKTNLQHGEEELDRYVKSLAQFAGKELSRRTPEVDAKIPDGSRAQLSLGEEVSEGGTNYTIRQFKNVPYTPIDLLNWRTYSVDQLAVLWLATENELSTLVAGGTGAGKTTTLNALSLFVPSSNKVVSIEDTQEITLPHRNWTKKLTREAGDQMDESTSIDEYDLLRSAFRMRPDHIIMGEVRGAEGQDLLQGMSSGHAGITTFHADTVQKVIHRFTTDPIGVSPSLFSAVDFIAVQTETRVDDKQVRRNTEIAEVGGYDAETDSLAVETIFERDAVSDSYEQLGTPNALEQVRQQRGWTEEELADELQKRRVVLAYLAVNGITDYRDVATTIQSFIQDEETVLPAIADDTLPEKLAAYRQLRNIEINATQTDEETLERPAPDDGHRAELESIVEEAEGEVL